MKPYTEQIEEIMIKHNFSSEREFARFLGISHRTVNAAVNGEHSRITGTFSTLLWLLQFESVIKLLELRQKEADKKP